MVPATSNRLLPIVVGVVLLLSSVVVMKSCDRGASDGVVMKGVPSTPAPDADTPADTIKTLTANVAAMTAEVGALRRDNAALREANEALQRGRTQIEENVATRLKRELLSDERTRSNKGALDASLIASLSDRVDALAASLEEGERAAGSDIPIGLGYDGVPPGHKPTMVWIEPLDAPETDPDPPGLLSRAARGADTYAERAANGWRETESPLSELEAAPRPVYTVPRNATLIGSTAMTALVGRIPVQGEVRDPMPFKLITGADNLAANGLRIPNVHGMIWSGTAIGDWGLACVTGRLESVTFVFSDGTIRTLPDDSEDADRGSGDATLGWISDARGIPCVSGTRKTNAPAFLAQRLGIAAVGAAAQAAAAAETTSVVSNTGSITDRVTGETGAFVLGRALAGGSDEIARWLLERQSQSFDAVFVPAGVEVAIHVDRALEIDYQPNGRKLVHETHTASARHARLD